MALNANALTLLSTAKDHLDIVGVSEDARIERLINTASEFIANYCKRNLTNQTYTEYIDGRSSNRLLLKHSPIIGGPETVGGNPHPAVYVDNSSVFDANSQLDPESYYVDSNICLVRVGGTNGISSGQTWPKGYRNIKVVYDAGFGEVNEGLSTNTLPSDLEQACLDYVLWLYDMRSDRRVGRTSKSKGGESVSFVQDMPMHIGVLLERYVLIEFPVEAPVGVANR